MRAIRCLLLGLVLSMAAAAVSAEDRVQLPGFPAGSWVGMIGSDAVRLRASASTTAAIVRSLNTGELCVIEGSSSKPQKIGIDYYYWDHVKLGDGTEGWVYGAFILASVNWSLPARVGSRDYVAAQFLKPEGADARGFSSLIIPALVDSSTHRGAADQGPRVLRGHRDARGMAGVPGR